MTDLAIFYDETTKSVVVRITEQITDKKIRVSEFQTDNLLAVGQMQDDLRKAQSDLVESKSLDNLQHPFVTDLGEAWK